jgi:hypothetical protein
MMAKPISALISPVLSGYADLLPLLMGRRMKLIATPAFFCTRGAGVPENSIIFLSSLRREDEGHHDTGDGGREVVYVSQRVIYVLGERSTPFPEALAVTSNHRAKIELSRACRPLP